MGIKKALVLADIHCPEEDKKALASVEKYMGEEKFDYVIYLGDFMDLSLISHHNKDKLRKVEGKRILKEYEAGNKILDRHQKLIYAHNPKCVFYFLFGNHCERISKYIDANPQLEGMIEVSKGLRLKERGFKEIMCYPDGEVLKINDLIFTHGSFTSSNPAKKHLEAYNSSVVFGHLHSPSMYTGVSYDKKNIKAGYGLGCLARFEQDYLKKAPSKWKKNFGVVYFPDKKHHQLYSVDITESGFVSPEGKEYK